MARARKIDPEMAVPAAMALFWQHGYGGLGTRQLEQETGITRFSLQTSYGGKMALFLKALDGYLEAFTVHGVPDMRDGELDTIADWFDARTTPAMFAEVACFGCLMLNSIIEFSGNNADVNARAERFYEMVRGGFCGALSAAQQKGNLPADFDVAAHAEICLGVAISQNVIIRSAANNNAGARMAAGMGAVVWAWGR
ncbi:MAG: TetR family transcriptional regulator [Amylibacter sp.]